MILQNHARSGSKNYLFAFEFLLNSCTIEEKACFEFYTIVLTFIPRFTYAGACVWYAVRRVSAGLLQPAAGEPRGMRPMLLLRRQRRMLQLNVGR